MQTTGTVVGKQARTTGEGLPVLQEKGSLGQQTQVSSTSPAIRHEDAIAAVNTVQYLPAKHHSQLVVLVGKRCIVSCFMDNYPVKVLWDTGVQSCITNKLWRQQYLPHMVIRPNGELLEGDTLTVLAANDTLIPYVGWIEVSFWLDDDRKEL